MGVWIGPINISTSCCADDVLTLSDSQDKMQCLLNIAEHCGKMFKIRYGADKTKITISGPEIDRQYYSDVSPWTMDGQQVSVVEDNDHLGLVISGNQQTQKNIDPKIEKGHKSLFSLVGPAFSNAY